MNQRLFLTLLWLVFGAQVASANTFTDANAAFKSGDFKKAAEGYEKSLKSDGPSAAAYYNLGNAYQRLGEYGPAILAYERARLITPRDPDLRSNLDKARKAVSAFEVSEGNPNVQAFLGYFSLNEWSWLLVGSAFVIGGIVFATGCKRWERHWMKVSAVSMFSASLLVIGIASTVLTMRRGETDRAVVLSKDAVLRLSPFAKAESVKKPGEGRIVLLGKKEGEFFYVTLKDQGVSGWMAEGDLGRMIP